MKLKEARKVAKAKGLYYVVVGSDKDIFAYAEDNKPFWAAAINCWGSMKEPLVLAAKYTGKRHFSKTLQCVEPVGHFLVPENQETTLVSVHRAVDAAGKCLNFEVPDLNLARGFLKGAKRCLKMEGIE